MEIFFFLEDGQNLLENRRITKKWIKETIESKNKKAGNIQCVFCSDEYLLKMNKQYLKHQTYTDIITFDYCEDDLISGDLFISTDRVKDNAKELNIQPTEELRRVIIHGVLHLLGYSDKTSKQKSTMRAAENHALERYAQLGKPGEKKSASDPRKFRRG